MGIFAGAAQEPTTHAMAVVSSDDGLTWRLLRPSPAFGLPSTAATFQSADGKIHLLYKALYSAGVAYARVSLVRDAGGHVVNFTSDLPLVRATNYPEVMLPPVNGNMDVRNDIKAGYDRAGNRRLFWVLYEDPGSGDYRGRVIAGMSSVAAGWNPTAAADWVSLANTPGVTLLKEFHDGGAGSSHNNTVHLAQHPVSNDLWIEWGPLNTCDSATGNLYPVQRLRCTPGSDHAWSVGTSTDVATFSAVANWQCLLGSITTTPDHVWFTRVDGATGIHIDSVDQDGRTTVDALPVPWGGMRCGSDMAFSINATETQAWLGMWVPYDSNIEPNAVFAMHWDGSSWVRYDDLDMGDTAGVAQSTGWDNGLVIVVPEWDGDWRVNLATIRTTGSSAPRAPAIVTPPAGRSVVAGQAATFTVSAFGTAPLHFQWRKNGGAIVGAPDAASYTTPAMALADNGSSYTVFVTNAVGGEVSPPATLNVRVAP